MTLSEASILVVDDEPILRLTFSMLLQRHAAAVHVAANGAEALQVLEEQRVDMMLTDQQMPVMDGMTLLRTMELRSLRVPSVLFVNGVEQHDPKELQRLNVQATVSKPVYPEDLIRLLTEALEQFPQPGEQAVQSA